MKTILYFILSIGVIIYVAAMCAVNIVGVSAVLAWGTIGAIVSGVASYGGIALVFAFALINFFGNPLKIVFFVILIIVLIVYILTLAVPAFFQNLFGVATGAELWTSF